MIYDIICYCSSSYKDALSKFLPSWLEFCPGRIHIYCDHDLPKHFENCDRRIGFYPEFSSCSSRGTNCARKTESLKLHMCQFTKPLVLLDVDCLLVNEIGHVFNDSEFDVAVTVDPKFKGIKAIRDISMGILFFNNTFATKQMIDEWIEYQRICTNPMREQRCFSEVVGRRTRLGNIKLKQLSRDIYNCYPNTDHPKDIDSWEKRLMKPLGLNDSYAERVCMIHFPHKLWRRDMEVAFRR